MSEFFTNSTGSFIAAIFLVFFIILPISCATDYIQSNRTAATITKFDDECNAQNGIPAMTTSNIQVCIQKKERR